MSSSNQQEFRSPGGESNGVKTSVDTQFSRAAGAYSTSAIHASGPDLARMLEAAHLQGHEDQLDAGCGPGHTALFFAGHVAQVTALDLSENMLAQGRRLAAERSIQNVDFRRGDVEQLPFPPQSFHLVTTRYSAHHWPDPQAALREFRRVLRPDGQLLLNDIVSFSEYTLDTHLQAIELLRDPSHVRDHTPQQWQTMLHHADFRAEVVHTWEVFIEFESWVKRIGTLPQSVDMLRTLLPTAPQEVKTALQIQDDGSFTLQAALLRGVPA